MANLEAFYESIQADGCRREVLIEDISRMREQKDENMRNFLALVIVERIISWFCSNPYAGNAIEAVRYFGCTPGLPSSTLVPSNPNHLPVPQISTPSASTSLSSLTTHTHTEADGSTDVHEALRTGFEESSIAPTEAMTSSESDNLPDACALDMATAEEANNKEDANESNKQNDNAAE